MRLALAFAACCLFFAPINGSYYLVKLAGNADNTGEEILHFDPSDEKEAGKEEKVFCIY